MTNPFPRRTFLRFAAVVGVPVGQAASRPKRHRMVPAGFSGGFLSGLATRTR